MSAAVSLCGIIDLTGVPPHRQVEVWTDGIRRFFPGVFFKRPPIPPFRGSAKGVRLGAAQVWRIVCPNQTIAVDPDAVGGMNGTFSVIVQKSGIGIYREVGRIHRINRGSLLLNNGRTPFEMQFKGGVDQVLLHIPRQIVLDRHPNLVIRSMATVDLNDPGAVLLKAAVLTISELADRLSEAQATIALSSLLQLIGTPAIHISAARASNAWRARRALADIECGFRDSDFGAKTVAQAQSISRRRLDDILIRETGKSLTTHIWQRRLTQAADDLVDKDQLYKSISQISFELGFEQQAHFSRVFKARFTFTPTQWRAKAKA
jgi:AraC-like DNA-binding protein